MNDIIYCCIMTDCSECKDASPELLSALGYDFSSWKDEESGVIRHTLYFQTEEDAENAKKVLQEKQQEFASFGVVFSDFVCSSLKKEDWAESWKIHFKPLVISDTLAISPTWIDFQVKPGQILIKLDPGMSFGTGQHATTKSCLASIDRFIKELRKNGKTEISMLDAGSGSGILAIAAAKLGCSRVDAFDIDPDTVGIARENAQKNEIPDEKLPIEAASLLEYESDTQYDLVAANILSSALIAGKEKLLSFCKPGTYLILAGILDAEYPRIKEAFEATGRCSELFNVQESEWRGGAFLVR